MRVAIVGCGAIASEYAPDLAAHPDLRLVAVADRVRERADRLADAHGATAHGSLDSLLDASEAPVVVNLTGHAAHAPVTAQALDAGRHVFSEKPLATSPGDARDLLSRVGPERRLACAPTSPAGDPQRTARRHVTEERLGSVRVARIDCNVGRPGEWHPRPESFRQAGPLLDAVVYPLTVLTALFGPVDRVRSADADRLAPGVGPDDAPDHWSATLSLAGGQRVDLRASGYVPFRAGDQMRLDVVGDEGTLRLPDAGSLGGDAADHPRYARLGADPVRVPPQAPRGRLDRAFGVAELAAAAREDRPLRVGSPGQAAHVVSAVDAVARAAETGGSATPVGVGWTPTAARVRRPESDQPEADGSDVPALPPVGAGTASYRGGETYVDLSAGLRAALDAGCRLLDCAELYGTESLVGDLIRAPGGPPRDALALVSKAWHTSHRPDHLRAACRASRDRLGVDCLDGYLLHGTEAWAHRGPLDGLSEVSAAEREALTFPTDDDGDPVRADVSLAETWAAMEGLVDDGHVRHLGLCNVSVDELAALAADARIPPRVVQVEHHPLAPRDDLVAWCRDNGVRVLGHTPLGPDGLLDDPTVRDVAASEDLTPAGAVLRWAVARGVVPIPSTADPDHAVANLDLFEQPLSAAGRQRLDGLA
jgi:diketogulonate reductase-like aldo/keto reductase/predicted dehydrogenase